MASCNSVKDKEPGGEPIGATLRKIVHIDMDAFYAAVEQRDQPALRGLPIAVGGGQTRGVVMTASYEARRFGVRSAMPGGRAARLCPELVFVRPRFEVYKAVSRQIRAIFQEHATLVEPLSSTRPISMSPSRRTGRCRRSPSRG
ncbi:MAG: hypothetical protein R3C69_10955 [Geminicoccaceae bacterium]